MQDRFKFRIFEYETKEMVELDAIGYSSFDPFAEGKSRLIMIPSGLGNTFHYDKQCLYDNDKFSEPMQSTGLKDKNGKLIYEGDIVKETLTDFINEEIITVVKWDKLNVTYNLENLQNCEIEVIGNIYENEELLE